MNYEDYEKKSKEIYAESIFETPKAIKDSLRRSITTKKITTHKRNSSFNVNTNRIDDINSTKNTPANNSKHIAQIPKLNDYKLLKLRTEKY